MPPPRRHVLPSRALPARLGSARRADAEYGRSDRPDWRTVRWRTKLRAVTIGGRRVHCVDTGARAGTPVLFVHGLGGRWQNWLENIPLIALERRVVAFDLPGFGRSQAPAEAISIPGYADVVDRLCDLLELDAAVVVGNSMGGFIAAELALRHPARVERLALVSAASVSIGDFNPVPASALLGALARTPLGTPDGMRAVLARRRARHLAFATVIRHPTRIAIDMLTELAAGRGAPGLANALTAMIGHDIRAELHRIAVPTLIVHGREDMLVPVADSIWLAQRLADARIEIFDDTGHLAMVERPIRFNAALLGFADA
jgi:pimeloyl-ACP methyl ester carboxylesterase